MDDRFLFTGPARECRPAPWRLAWVTAMTGLASCGPAHPPPPAAVATQRANLNFNVDWKYQQGAAIGADAVTFDDTAWSYVDLPHSTKFVTPEDPNAATGISWYRKHFTVPSGFEGEKVFIEFKGAMQLADVWVNGTHKIQHQGGYAPFTIDVTGDVTTGSGDNTIAVRLDSNYSPSWPPGRGLIDFQYDGGLYRDVVMHVTSKLHVTDAVYANKVAGGGVFVTYPSVSANMATVNVVTNVVNEFSFARDVTVVSELVDGVGQVVGSDTAQATIHAGTDFDFAESMDVPNPQLWSPDTPTLYTLRTTVKDGVTPVDDLTTRVGIRSIKWSHTDGLVINGTRLKVHGVNMHQEMYGLGGAVPEQSIFYDVKRIKDAGLSFIRGSHYPHAPAFYDACDALGVLVLDAQTGWQYFSPTTAFVDATYQELRDMIRRDRNHPSVVAWEASLNESPFTDDWAQMANATVHQEYPGDQAYSAAWLLSRADILIDASQHNIRASTDQRPIIIDEYGDYDYGGLSSTSRQAREAGDSAMLTQANNLEDGQSKNMALPWFTADGYWDYADYGGFSNTGITLCGVVDMYRLPKFSYYFLQSQRDPGVVQDGVDSGPVVYIANQWTPTSPTTVRVYGNCDQVSLFLNDNLVETRAPDAGTNLAHPPFNFDLGTFTPGTLRAECLLGDTRVSTFARRTPGVATTIALRPEATTLRADMSDARLVFIDILDADGTVVPTNSSQVTLTVSGPGSLVGPTAVTMKGGQLATWVRAGRTGGIVTLTASAPGLASGSVDLTAETVPDLPAAPADRQ